MKTLTEEEFYNLPKKQQTGCVIYSDRSKDWYKEGKPHRDDGPAREYANGNKFWFKEGKLHRDNGPAVEYVDGTKVYYLNNIKCSYNQLFAISNNLEKFI